MVGYHHMFQFYNISKSTQIWMRLFQLTQIRFGLLQFTQMFITYVNLNEPLLLQPDLSNSTQVWMFQLPRLDWVCWNLPKCLWLYTNFNEALAYYPNWNEIVQSYPNLKEAVPLGPNLTGAYAVCWKLIKSVGI